MSFCRRKRLGALVKCFPVRQARAFFLHVQRVPPFFDGKHASLAEIRGLTRFEALFHGLLAGGFPHLHGDVEVTRFQAGELGDVVGLLVFHVITHLFQHPAHDMGGDVLAGPIVNGQNYGIFRLWRAAHRGR